MEGREVCGGQGGDVTHYHAERRATKQESPAAYLGNEAGNEIKGKWCGRGCGSLLSIIPVTTNDQPHTYTHNTIAYYTNTRTRSHVQKYLLHTSS